MPLWQIQNLIPSKAELIIFLCSNLKGSETEVTRDFVFRREASLWEPPQATIGLQRSVLPGVGGHCCTAPFVFCESNLAYVTALFLFIVVDRIQLE